MINKRLKVVFWCAHEPPITPTHIEKAKMFTTGFAVLIASLFIYAVVQTIYNVFFHPLANVPGPRLAAITRLWFFVTDISGDSSVRILKWHQTHGASYHSHNSRRTGLEE